MKIIKVRKENFDIDRICNVIVNTVHSCSIGHEGVIYSAQVDSKDNQLYYSASYYDEYDYNLGKELFYKEERALVLPFIKIYEEDNKMDYKNKKYNIKHMEEWELGVGYPSKGFVYIDCHKEYVYISMAYYRGVNSTIPVRIVIDADWGVFDTMVLDFLNQFINKREDEEWCKVDRRPSLDKMDTFKKKVYVFNNKRLILTDTEINYKIKTCV